MLKIQILKFTNYKNQFAQLGTSPLQSKYKKNITVSK